MHSQTFLLIIQLFNKYVHNSPFRHFHTRVVSAFLLECSAAIAQAMASGVQGIVSKLQVLARPRFVNGVWKKPIISRRKLAVIRRSMVAEGEEWPARELRDRGSDKPLKLSRKEREREER